jgi:uncharacterized GH25 family protein
LALNIKIINRKLGVGFETKSQEREEYQVRDKRSLLRHFILVFCAYSFILWHKLTGGLQRRWANQPLNTFTEALEAFRTAMSFRFFDWLTRNRDVFAAYKASLGFIWA